jgi:predicted nucleic acid-binding protein
MNIVDSSLWLEYFAGTTEGKPVSEVIKNTGELLVPVIILYEVFKKLLTEKGEHEAIFAAAHIRQGSVIDIDAGLAISAARFSKELKLPLADSIIYAAAKRFGAVIWTQDQHFEGLDGVEYYKK